MRVFVDTNLWVYRLDHRNPNKRDQIGRWLQQLAREQEIVISTQVLIEFRAVATRKLQPPLPAEQISALLEALSGFEVVGSDAALVLDAHQLALQHQLSWFDALIAEAATRSGCTLLYSEDFNHGSRLGALQVINPLAT